MSPESPREKLKSLIVRRSVRHGDVHLASGLTSDVYVDGKLTTCSAAGTVLVGKVFLDRMKELGWSPAAVGGLTLGADPIVVAIARESTERLGPTIDSFFVRKEAKKHGLQKFIEGIRDEDLPGLSVVIVDDVCTTGGSTATAIKYARAAGMNVIGALGLVDREMGATEKLKAELNCRFECVFTLNELLAAEEQNAHEPVAASAA